MPGSDAVFTAAQVDDLFLAPDWRPADHPPMPGVVAHGRAPDLYACGYCHLPNGQGRPENASLAGLPAAYIVQQVEEFRAGRRRSATPGLYPQKLMAQVAANARPDEIALAAAYFASLAYRPWISVVETRDVPRTRVTGASAYEPIPGGGLEPLGQRIIEVPQSPERTAARDAASGFVAYVPMGSVARGETLVTLGGDGAAPCGACHGAALGGQGAVPRLAGRSPSYLARQLFDLRAGARHGPAVALMRPQAARLSNEDVIDIAAYLASRQP
jgi:cytochrome c553